MKDVEKIIRDSINKITPDDFNAIIVDLPEKEPKKKWYSYFKPTYALSLALCLLTIFSLIGYSNNNKVFSTISLDVNPSIVIKANNKDKVLSVEAFNEDAEKVIGDMDFKGSNIDVTLNALIGSLLRNGYLNENANSILISIESNNQEKSKMLETQIVKEINDLLSGDNLQAATLSQLLESDDQTKELAEKYGITKGKVKLIEEILADVNNIHSFDELVPLTINELNLILQKKQIVTNNISSTGEASDKAYIGEEKAKEIAFNQAGVSGDSVSAYECELDYENNCMVYEIEFVCDGIKHELDIQAADGTVCLHEKEGHYDNHEDNYNHPESSSTNDKEYIGHDKAKQIALNSVDIYQEQIHDYECELDDKQTMVYEIEFKANNIEYEIIIDAFTGDIITSHQEKGHDHH